MIANAMVARATAIAYNAARAPRPPGTSLPCRRLQQRRGRGRAHPAAARSAAAQAQAAVALARANRDRAVALAPSGRISRQELQQAETALAAAEAAAAAAGSQVGGLAVKLGETRITSPLDGVVSA